MPPRGWTHNLRSLDPDTLLKLVQGLSQDPDAWVVYKLVALTPIELSLKVDDDIMDQLYRLEQFRKHFLHIKVYVECDKLKSFSSDNLLLKYTCVRWGIPFEIRLDWYHEAGPINTIPFNVWRLNIQVQWPSTQVDISGFYQLRLVTINSNYSDLLEVMLPPQVRQLEVSDVCHLNMISSCPKVYDLKLANIKDSCGVTPERFPQLKLATFDNVSAEVVTQVVTIPTVHVVTINTFYDAFPANINEVHVFNGVGSSLGLEDEVLDELLSVNGTKIYSISSDFAFLLTIPSSIKRLNIIGNTEVNFPPELESLKWDSPLYGFHYPINLTLLHITKGPSSIPTFYEFMNLRLLTYTDSELEIAVIEAPKIRMIDLRNNRVKKVSVPMSTRTLKLEGNQMSFLPPISHLTQLQSLTVLSPNLKEINADCPKLTSLRINGEKVESIVVQELVEKLDYDNMMSLREVKIGNRAKSGTIAISKYLKQVHSGRVAINYHPETTRLRLILHGPCSPSYFIFPQTLETLILHYHHYHQPLDLSRSSITNFVLKVEEVIEHAVILPQLVEYLEISCKSNRVPIEFVKPSRIRELWILPDSNDSSLPLSWKWQQFNRQSYPNLRKINGKHPELFIRELRSKSCFIT